MAAGDDLVARVDRLAALARAPAGRPNLFDATLSHPSARLGTESPATGAGSTQEEPHPCPTPPPTPA